MERYARVFDTTEINSSFYRPHQRKTYARWAASVPDGFTFSVKMPKEITHEHKLINCETPLQHFLDKVAGLGPKLAVLLIQLPPRLQLDIVVAKDFFALLRASYDGLAACEPRHASWFSAEGQALLQDFKVARVAADPSPIALAADPGGWEGFRYYRLHGSPKMYYSAYTPAFLQEIAAHLSQPQSPAWCIFDNTTLGAAIPDALTLIRLLET
ncbi:MAG TPA: DUF72 domain-containing protein [Methylophilaceae bacterium]|nr:DUF72 domain-containing protein [Methylophilaceae bacterium]